MSVYVYLSDPAVNLRKRLFKYTKGICLVVYECLNLSMGKTKDFTSRINNVFDLVKSGFTIEKAVEEIGWNTKTFYRVLTEDQKKELKVIKLSNAKFCKYGGASRTCNHMNVFIDNDYL